MFKLLQRFVAVTPIVVALAVCQETWALAGTVGTINGRVTDDAGQTNRRRSRQRGGAIVFDQDDHRVEWVLRLYRFAAGHVHAHVR